MITRMPLVILLGIQLSFANELELSNAEKTDAKKYFNVSIDGLYSMTFGQQMDYPVIGGSTFVSFKASKVREISFGMDIGCLFVSPQEYCPVGFHLLPKVKSTWNIPVKSSIVTIPVSIGGGLGINLLEGQSLFILKVAIESGLKIQINNRVALSIILEGGMLNYMRYKLCMFDSSIKVGPVFSFWKIKQVFE